MESVMTVIHKPNSVQTITIYKKPSPITTAVTLYEEICKNSIKK
jgi:hypothetical protein